ncbi:MAG: C40 family peptidase [Bacteroidales bacterium]|nr:C40 family peptidase [Bacteroidales bacterium]
MEKGICLLSIIPLRKDPSDKSEMVSQLLFGETYEIKEENSAWYRILTGFDAYSGWIDKKMHSHVSDAYYRRIEQGRYTVTSSISATLLTSDNNTLTITAGSTLGENIQNGLINIDTHTYRLAEKLSGPFPQYQGNIMDTAKQFLYSPYLWGGRSPFGFDCSGYIQIVYKIMGRKLYRDAAQQATMGKPVNTLQQLHKGDLVFFCNDDHKVVHAGLAMPPDKIIHCSGMVRTDFLDEKGIFNQQTREYTHRLHSMRRVI